MTSLIIINLGIIGKGKPASWLNPNSSQPPQPSINITYYCHQSLPECLNVQLNTRPTFFDIPLDSIPHTIDKPSRPTSSNKNSTVDRALVHNLANHRVEIRAAVFGV